MNQSTKWIVGVIVVVAIVAVGYFVSLGPSGPVSTEPIKIGVILPLSGDLASVAEDVQKGINLFKKNHPDAEFIIENDEGDIKKSVSALKKLTELDNVHYILGPLGPVNSEAVYSAQSDSNKNKLTLIAWSMCADQFKGYGNMLCVYPSPYFQLKESYKYPETVGKTTYSLIYSNDAFGKSIQDMFQKFSAEIGIKPVGNDAVNTSDLEFSIAASKAIGAKPQFIVVATQDQPANIKIVKAIKERKYDGMILSGGDFNEKTVKEFQRILEGVYLTGQAKLDYSSDFLKLYSEENEGIPSLYTAFGYVWSDVLYNLLKSKSNHQFTIEEIMDYIDSHLGNLAIKGVKYDHDNREIKFPMQVFLVKNGNLETVFISGKD